MSKTKCMLTGFAIFAAMLMLMTPCMARPVAESTNMAASKNAQQKAVDSIEAMFLKIENNQEFKRLIEQLSANDPNWDDFLDLHNGLQDMPKSILPGLSILLFIIAFILDNIIFLYNEANLLIKLLLLIPMVYIVSVQILILTFANLVGWSWAWLFDKPTP